MENIVVDPIAIWRRGSAAAASSQPTETHPGTCCRTFCSELPKLILLLQLAASIPLVDPDSIFRRCHSEVADPIKELSSQRTPRKNRDEIKRKLLLPETIDSDRARECTCSEKNCPSKVPEGKQI